MLYLNLLYKTESISKLNILGNKTGLICNSISQRVPLDFVNTHSYGVRQGFLDEFGKTGTVLSEDEWAVSGDVLKNRQEIAVSSMPNIELHDTEWSSSYTPADPVHDSYHQAAYILQKLKQVGDAAQSMSYWVFTDIFEGAGPRFQAFHGGFGLMNTHGIKKPAYFAYQFLNQLGQYELATADAMSWATMDEQGNVQILLWDFSYTLPPGINNQQYYIQNLPAKPKDQIAIQIEGLRKGNYALTISQVGYQQNDSYTAYVKMGAPAQLTQKQVAELKQIASGAPLSTQKVKIKKQQSFATQLLLRESDVYLLEFKGK